MVKKKSRANFFIDYNPCCLDDLIQNLIAKKIKSPVRIIDIGISDVLLLEISESVEVNILRVSWIAPKLNTENNIARAFHLFIQIFDFKSVD